MIHIKLIIMALLWAGGFIASKLIITQAGPFTISFLRFLIASFVMSTIALATEQRKEITLGLFACILSAAFLGVFCYNYFFFAGMEFIEAGRGAVIIGLVPMIVAVFSVFILREKITVTKMMGIVLSIFGAWVVIGRGDLGLIFTEHVGKGELYLFICVFCAAAFTLLSKRILVSLRPVVTMAYVSVIGTLLLFGPAMIEMRQIPVHFGSISFLMNLIYLSLGPSVIAVIYYYEAISQLGASKASQYMNLIPVFGVILSYLIFGESLTFSLLIGGGLVTTGLYITNVS